MERTSRQKSSEGKPQSGSVHFDYKNISLLEKYLNQHARIHGRRRTELNGREQRLLAQAIKRARFMALMPYVSR